MQCSKMQIQKLPLCNATAFSDETSLDLCFAILEPSVIIVKAASTVPSQYERLRSNSCFHVHFVVLDTFLQTYCTDCTVVQFEFG